MVDRIGLDFIRLDSTIGTSSAAIGFGVCTYQSGTLGDSALAVDGIFGLGQGPLSPISQLASRGVIPPVFSHCLKGEGLGGGTFVLGEISEPGIVYTPMVPAQPHYNIYLQSITVNGELLPVDPAVFATSTGRGTFVDSGTTLAYLVEEAYEPFVSAVSKISGHWSTKLLFCFCLLCCYFMFCLFLALGWVVRDHSSLFSYRPFLSLHCLPCFVT
ncbi:unnamed protein product, partial [Linum tenue]